MPPKNALKTFPSWNGRLLYEDHMRRVFMICFLENHENGNVVIRSIQSFLKEEKRRVY